eukprot:scaffold47187_cov27-Prasinocladus_malaysianus.AAC.1
METLLSQRGGLMNNILNTGSICPLTFTSQHKKFGLCIICMPWWLSIYLSAELDAEEAVMALLLPAGRQLLHPLPEGRGDVLALVAAHHVPHVRHVGLHDELDERQQVKQHGVPLFQLPGGDLSRDITFIA